MNVLSNRVVAACFAVALLVGAPRAHAQQEQPSATLKRGLDAYKNKNYEAAAIDFKRVLDRETADSDANQQRAELMLAGSLRQLGYDMGSLAYYNRIVDAGDAHHYYLTALRGLVALSHDLPVTAGVLEKIGTYDPGVFDHEELRDVRDELNVLAAQHFYDRGEFDRAIELLGKVRKSSPLFVKATFLTGVLYVRKYEGRPAVDAFKQVLELARARPSQYKAAELIRFEELANLQLARVFYSMQQYDVALKYYARIPRSSASHGEAVFESAWASFMLGQDSRAVAALQRVQAPSMAFHAPEARLLETVVYHRRCLYNTALKSTGKYDLEYRPLRDHTKAHLDKYQDNAEFYEYIKKLDQRDQLDRNDEFVAEHLHSTGVVLSKRLVDAIDRELALLAKARKAWQNTQIGGDVMTELTLRKSLAEADTGKLAREALERSATELRELGRDMVKIKIETLNGKASHVRRDEPDDEPDDDGGSKADSDPELQSDLGSAKPMSDERFDPNDPELAEDAWAPARSGSANGDAPVTLRAEHLVWKLNRGFAQSKPVGYRYRLRWKCAKAEPTPESSQVSGAGDVHGEPPGPNGDGVDTRRFKTTTSLIRVRKDFTRNILRSVAELRASGLL